VTTQSLLRRVEGEAMAAGLSISNLGGSLGVDDTGDGQITGQLGVGQLLGGGSQVYIPGVDPSWLVPR
jgi:hypothetical protein